MRKQTGVWIDGTQAYVITFYEGEEVEYFEVIPALIENRIYHAGEGDKGSWSGTTHIAKEKKFDQKKRHQIKRYLQRILPYLEDSEQLFIMGPGAMKNKLLTAVQNHYATNPKILEVVTANKLTKNQMIVRVKEVFGIL